MRHLELHILQSIPVSCLNRDDLGSPKTAMFGGVQRARVSSQCWKRAIRDYAKELLPAYFNGMRTRLIVQPLRDFLIKHGQDADMATENAHTLVEELAKLDKDALAKKGKEQSKTLLFTTRRELEAIALSFIETGNAKKAVKALSKNACVDAADIALFGRMAASAPDLTLEGAAMFAHALSTHKADNDPDFFSALDDLQPEEETGAGMTGTLEYNSATYYRFVALNLDMLADDKHLGMLSREERQTIVAGFVEATLKALPTAKQNSMNAAVLPAYVLCVLREKGHPVQLVNAFEQAIWSQQDQGYLAISIKKMEEEYTSLQNVWNADGQCLRMPEKNLVDLLHGVREHVV